MLFHQYYFFANYEYYFAINILLRILLGYQYGVPTARKRFDVTDVAANIAHVRQVVMNILIILNLWAPLRAVRYATLVDDIWMTQKSMGIAGVP